MVFKWLTFPKVGNYYINNVILVQGLIGVRNLVKPVERGKEHRDVPWRTPCSFSLFPFFLVVISLGETRAN